MNIEEPNGRGNKEIRRPLSFFKAGIIICYLLFTFLELFIIIAAAAVPPSGHMKSMIIGIVVLVLQTALMLFAYKRPKMSFFYIVFLLVAVTLNSFKDLMVVELGIFGLIFFILVLAALTGLYVWYIRSTSKIAGKE